MNTKEFDRLMELKQEAEDREVILIANSAGIRRQAEEEQKRKALQLQAEQDRQMEREEQLRKDGQRHCVELVESMESARLLQVKRIRKIVLFILEAFFYLLGITMLAIAMRTGALMFGLGLIGVVACVSSLCLIVTKYGPFRKAEPMEL